MWRRIRFWHKEKTREKRKGIRTGDGEEEEMTRGAKAEKKNGRKESVYQRESRERSERQKEKAWTLEEDEQKQTESENGGKLLPHHSHLPARETQLSTSSSATTPHAAPLTLPSSLQSP